VTERRWDFDDRGTGIADGKALTAGVARLVETMREPGWVTEQPEAHLLPHIRRACAANGRLQVLGERLEEDAVYVVELEWTAQEPVYRTLREDVWTVIGSFAETSTHVAERETAGSIEFDVTTGVLPEHTEFRTHGHLVRFRVAVG
jgi:hypothetical protein